MVPTAVPREDAERIEIVLRALGREGNLPGCGCNACSVTDSSPFSHTQSALPQGEVEVRAGLEKCVW